MKKFVLFLTVVLMGVFPTVSSYAECGIQADSRPDTSDDVLYLNKKDWTGPADPTIIDDSKKNYYLKCDVKLLNDKICEDGTLVFVTKSAYIGDSFRDLNTVEPFSIIRCETGVNDKWEKVGGIEALKKCGNKALKYTINVAGKTVHCKRKENQNGHEYCIGSKTPDDICIEQAEESKQDPKEEEQLVNCEEGYEYDPKQGDCVEKYVTEEPKKEEKAPAKKKANQKSGKEIFKEYCNADGGVLDNNDTRCTITDTAEGVYLDKYKDKFKKRSKCGELKHQNNKIWSIDCTISGFEGTWFIGITNITCKSGSFNKSTGECDAADSAAAEEPKNTEPAEEPKNTEPAEQTDDDISGLIAKFQKEADEVVDVFKTQAKKIKANQQ